MRLWAELYSGYTALYKYNYYVKNIIIITSRKTPETKPEM